MPRKPRMMLSELAALWDGDADVRSHLRKFNSVLHVDGPTFRPTVSSCSQNVSAILPVLQLTQEQLNSTWLSADNADITSDFFSSSPPTKKRFWQMHAFGLFSNLRLLI